MNSAIARSTAPELSVVIPCYNEEDVLQLLRGRLVNVLDSLDIAWEAILVDDGSTDETYRILASIHREDSRFKVISFSRNFGHQAAVAAGLRYAAGAAVAVMDADLQDPPEILVECLKHWRSGYEVVFAVRRGRQENIVLRAAYSVFYRLLNLVADVKIPLDAGDFCLMDRRAVNALRRMPERNMFIRGMRAWVGFRQLGLVYERPERTRGKTKYSFSKLVRLALDGIFSFSSIPLRLATILGLLIVALSIGSFVFVLIWRVFHFEFLGHTARDVPGWAAGFSATVLLAGVQLLILGLVGEYIARIYEEVKRRPRWVIRAVHGIKRSATRRESESSRR